jgi:hypothetical protein
MRRPAQPLAHPWAHLRAAAILGSVPDAADNPRCSGRTNAKVQVAPRRAVVIAQDRETRIPEEFLQAPEGWELDGDPVTCPVEDQDALEEAIRAAATVTRFIGGVVQIAAIREEVAPKIFVPREYVWRWNSFLPPAKAQTVDNGAAKPVAAEAG